MSFDGGMDMDMDIDADIGPRTWTPMWTGWRWRRRPCGDGLIRFWMSCVSVSTVDAGSVTASAMTASTSTSTVKSPNTTAATATMARCRLDGGMDFDIDFDGGMDDDIDFDGGGHGRRHRPAGHRHRRRRHGLRHHSPMADGRGRRHRSADIDIDVDGGMDFDGGMDVDADIGPLDDIDVDGGMDMDADGGPPLASCEDASVLFYVYSDEAAEVTAAADELGMPYDTASSASEFASMAASMMPDIVVFSTPTSGYDDSVRTTLQSQLDSGGSVITSFWYYQGYPELQDTLGVSVSTSIDAAPTLIESDADSMFWNAYETLPGAFTPAPGDSYGDNGDKWLDSGIETLARFEGEPIIALSNDGSTIVNGLLFADFVGMDSDGDGTPDLTELVTNELSMIRVAKAR